jgi:hypothetical protein
MPGQKLIHQPMDVYMASGSQSILGQALADTRDQLSLFIADLIQALGAIVNVKWLNEGKVFVGPLCNAQGRNRSACNIRNAVLSSGNLGITQQVGETSVAIHTLVWTQFPLFVYSCMNSTLGKSTVDHRSPNFHCPLVGCRKMASDGPFRCAPERCCMALRDPVRRNRSWDSPESGKSLRRPNAGQ